MATINAPSLSYIQYSGDCPAAHAHGAVTLNAANIADKVRLVKLYAGTKIHGCRMVNAALGGASTVSVGFEYTDGQAGGGAAIIIPATSTAAAANTPTAVAPFLLLYDAYVTATVGGAVATGQLDVAISFEFRGV